VKNKMKLEKKCEHVFVIRLGFQEHPTNPFLLGTCVDCNSTIHIDDKYKKITKRGYILKTKCKEYA